MRRIIILLALVSALACKGKDNTKIVVAVWSDLAVPADVDSVRIDVPGTGSQNFPLTASSQSGQTSLVAELELVPLGAKNETFTVTATGLHAGNQVVAQTASVSFVAGQSLLLRLFLSGSCIVAKCNANYTCSAGACQPVSVPNLPPYDPGVPLSPPDASVVVDGGGEAIDSGSPIDSGTRETGTGGADLRATDARSVEGGASDVPVSAGGVSRGSGGAGGAGGSSGTGGSSGGAGATTASGGAATGGIVGAGGVGAGGTGGSLGGTIASGGVVVSGGILGTGGVSSGGTTAACQETATQCLGNGLQTCTNGQWGTAVACGAHQTCTGVVGTAKCTCNVDPVCSSVGSKCTGASTLATCAQDAQACFYQSSPPVTCGVRQSCTGAVGAAACTCNADSVCSSVGSRCTGASTLTTCARDAQACLYQSSPPVTCGVRQSCTGAAGAAACTCNPDSVCSSAGGTCIGASTLVTCAQDAQTCLYQASATTCSNGACTGAAGSASCCTNACTVGTTCLSGTSLQTCAVGANGCTSATTTACTCTGPAGSASCLNSSWAGWPMPNDQVDVTAGAPNLESYTDNGDGTVTDNITGLMWQQTVPTGTYTWSQAVAYCPTLSLAGHSDWRLPSRIELVSIVDFGVTSGATINATYFPSTPTSWFWSSSPLAGSSSSAWVVGFDDGYTSYGGVSNTGDVRCVR